MLDVARVPSRTAGPPALVASTVREYAHEAPGVAIPWSEARLVARFGASVRGGFDVHAMGARQEVHRKLVRPGRVVVARLQLGATRAVLQVPAPLLTGRIVALEDLWGAAATRSLYDRLAAATSLVEAARVLERAIAERLRPAGEPHAGLQLVHAAALRLSTDPVNVVADDLRVSERHLRRLFHDAVGVGPKQYARILRFRRAVASARDARIPGWAGIAAAAGYYDQAHLIAEFKALAGVTPQRLLGELRFAQSIG